MEVIIEANAQNTRASSKGVIKIKIDTTAELIINGVFNGSSDLETNELLDYALSLLGVELIEKAIEKYKKKNELS